MTKILLVVFDGLRPDMLRPETTPNLLRFAGLGTRFTQARSVFPSETRVCSASVATGCLPARHGLVANRFVHPHDFATVLDTGSAAVLRRFQQSLGTSPLDVPTLGDLLATRGLECTVLSSGTSGQTFVLNPGAAAHGHRTLSVHGKSDCSPAGAALLATVRPPPAAPADRAVWIAELFRVRVLPDPPPLTILWLCEPDTSGHHAGLGSAAQYAALAAADAAFGRILDDWQAGPQRDTLQIIVASDHGHATVTGRVDIAARLPDPDLVLVPGSSCSLSIPPLENGCHDLARIAALSGWLTQQDWCGPIYAADAAERPPGVLPLSLLQADHPRAAPIAFMLRGDAEAAASGLPGRTLYDGNLDPQSGTHGGLLAAELHIVLMLAGSHVRPSEVTHRPAGLVDLAPTMLDLLNFPGGEAMDGRVLVEALRDRPAPPDMSALDIPAPETWQAASPGYAQTLHRTRLGRQIYLDEAVRLAEGTLPPLPASMNTKN